MSELLREIVVGLVTFITTGGLGSIMYFKLQKRLKQAEVKAAEIDNFSSINAEWEKITNKLTNEREELVKELNEQREEFVKEIHDQAETIKELQDKIDSINTSKEAAWDECSKSKIECAIKDKLISELNWYRCEINGCPYRKPPRIYGEFEFPSDGVIKNDD